MDENEYQNTEVSQVRESAFKKHFYTVTPLSKYLAMILFVALPFLGFWVGVQFQDKEHVEGHSGNSTIQTLPNEQSGGIIETTINSGSERNILSVPLNQLPETIDKVLIVDIENSLVKHSGDFFQVKKEDGKWGEIMLVNEADNTSIPIKEVGTPGVSSGPKISPDGEILAYIQSDESFGRTFWVTDTLRNEIRISDEDYSVGVNYFTEITSWSPDSNKLLYDIGDCMSETGCERYSDDMKFGYFLVDLNKKTVHFLDSLDSIFMGWLNSEVVLFERRDGRKTVLYEYYLPGSELYLSKTFGFPGEKHDQFSYIGSNGETYLIMTPKISNQTTGPQDLKIITAKEEKIITSAEWAEIQPNSIYFSEDGKNVLYKRSRGDMSEIGNYKYEISSGEIIKLD